ncbi:MAG: hypothetical protein PHQ60_16255 [Sideroxydans sp.]|nr:hypothetical protein [Sideroxydans sp.]
MARNISEFGNKPVFEEAEQQKVEDLLGKDLSIKGYASRTGETGEFLVINADLDGKNISFANGGRVIVEKLKRVAEIDEVTPDDNMVVMFKSPVDAKIKQIKSKEGRMYYDLVDSEEQVK